MPQGRIKWFNNAKGYGFIVQDGGPEIFVHYSAIEGEGYKTLAEGQEVEFEISDSDKGPQATKVTRKD
ncbi:MAG: cold shock domain-containing protein [Candidatus Binatia bacterium]|nr:cold shock domain-containing protein [Candidatus Binatia bacterium]